MFCLLGVLLWPPLGYLRGHLLDYLTTSSRSSLHLFSPLSISLSFSLWCVLWSFRSGVAARMCMEAKAYGGVGYQTRSRLPTASFFSVSPSPPPLLRLSLSFSLSVFRVRSSCHSLSVCLSLRPFPSSRQAAILGNV